MVKADEGSKGASTVPTRPRGARPFHEPTRAERSAVVLRPGGGGFLRHRITGDSGPLPSPMASAREWPPMTAFPGATSPAFAGRESRASAAGSRGHLIGALGIRVPVARPLRSAGCRRTAEGCRTPVRQATALPYAMCQCVEARRRNSFCWRRFSRFSSHLWRQIWIMAYASLFLPEETSRTVEGLRLKPVEGVTNKSSNGMVPSSWPLTKRSIASPSLGAQARRRTLRRRTGLAVD
jgi:hypothetical protein